MPEGDERHLAQIEKSRLRKIAKVADENAYKAYLTQLMPTLSAQDEKMAVLFDAILERAAQGPLSSEDLQLMRILAPERREQLNRMHGRTTKREQVDSTHTMVDAAALLREGRQSHLDAGLSDRIAASEEEIRRLSEGRGVAPLEVVDAEVVEESEKGDGEW